MNPIHTAILEAVQQVGLEQGTLLDIGCGKGDLTRALAAKCKLAVSGVDVLQPKSGWRDSGAEAVTSVRFMQASAEHLPFGDDTFDIVTASLTLHHWSDKRAGLAEAFRVLKPGGLLVIGDPLVDEQWPQGQGQQPRPGQQRQPGLHGFLVRFVEKLDTGTFTTTANLTDYLNSVGFSAVQIRVVSRTWRSLFLITATKSR